MSESFFTEVFSPTLSAETFGNECIILKFNHVDLAELTVLAELTELAMLAMLAKLAKLAELATLDELAMLARLFCA